MLVVWLKALHISALVIWCGGILVLLVLFAYRPADTSKPELWQLQRVVRFAYTVVISPAAFVAVVRGTGARARLRLAVLGRGLLRDQGPIEVRRATVCRRNTRARPRRPGGPRSLRW